MDKKKRIMAIIGLIIIGLCISWIIRIYWPVITGERSNLGMVASYLIGIGIVGITNGGILLFCALITPSKRFQELVKSEKKERDESEIEEMIYNYLKININKAFTAKIIMERLFSDNLNYISKELVENSLKNLVKNGKIQQSQKENEIFYFFK